MRTFVFRLVAVSVFLLPAGACTDSLTQPVVARAAVSGPSSDEAAQGCVKLDGTGECTLPPISGGWCEPDDATCDDGGGDCMESTPPAGDPGSVGVEGCDEPAPGPGPGGPEPGPGGNGGGGGTPPPNAPGDTCNTGDPVVDDPDVSRGVEALWVQSNPDANLYQRVEKAGWIVEYPTGQFSVVQWTGGTEGFGCGDYTVAVPPQGTVVGFVHTHPYQVDEPISDCKMTNVQFYTGAPSTEDRATSQSLGNYLGRSGPLPGYIIDKDGYYRFEGSRYTATPRLPRCGY